MKDKNFAIGIDIGGSHISVGVVDLNINQLVPGSGFESKVDNKASADEILNAWVGTIQKAIDVIEKIHLAGIGFAMPGPFDYANGIALFEKVEKYLNLYGVHVDKEIRQRLELPVDMPVRFINDATAFAVAESWIGVGRYASRMIALTLGTGFGSAFIDKGIPVLEGDNVPEMGCVWHLPFGDGIADEYFSTRWFENSYLKLTGKKIHGVKEIAALSATDDVAHKLFIEYGSNMGAFLAPWIKKFDAEQIVIGGNITGAFNKFGDALLQSLTQHGANIPVSLSVLKEDAAIIGSARLIDDSFFAKVNSLLSKM